MGRKKLVDFVPAMEGNEEIEALAAEVKAFATSFPMPGFEVSSVSQLAQPTSRPLPRAYTSPPPRGGWSLG